MRPGERDALRHRFTFRCGYCGVSEESVGAELTSEREQVLEEARRQQEELRRRVASLEAMVAEAERRLRSE